MDPNGWPDWMWRNALGMGREELAIVQAAAASLEKSPPGIERYAWLPRSCYPDMHALKRGWLQALGILDTIRLEYRIPYPPLCYTWLGWNARFRVVLYDVDRVASPGRRTSLPNMPAL